MPEIGTADGGAGFMGGTGAVASRPGGLDVILGYAESALGVMYRWGGNSLATGVDCSGLVQQAFRAAGYNLPRVSNQQAQAGVAADVNSMQPGDLLYWDNSSRNNGADHIAIYVGNGMMIEAARSGTPVKVSPVRPPTGVRRVIGHAPRTSNAPRVTAGPNADRKYTNQALTVVGAPPIGNADGPAGLGGAALAGGLSADTPGAGPMSAPGTRLVSDGAGGYTVSAPSGRTITSTSSEAELDRYVQENYPQFVGLLNIPEVRALVMRAGIEDWDDVEFAASLRETAWYQNTSPVTREWMALAGADPAAAEKQVSDITGTLRTQWQAAGGFTGPGADAALRQLATDSLLQSLTPEETNQRMVDLIRQGDKTERDFSQGDEQDAAVLASGDRNRIMERVRAIFTNAGVAIGTSVESDDARLSRIADEVLGGRSFDDIRKSVDQQKPAIGPGTISATVDSLRATSRDYLVPLDSATLEDWAFRIAQGNATEQGFNSFLTGLAKGRFSMDPSVTAFIEQGGTPGQYFASHRQTVAQLLELSPDQIDLMNPKWMPLTEQVDDKGNRRAPTLAEAAAWARHRPEYSQTRQAVDETHSLQDELLRTFGMKR